jgi:hypothetical protein
VSKPSARLFRALPLLLAFLTLAACAGPSKPRDFAPLTYDYLPQIRLNVASVDVDNRFVPASRDEVSDRSPIPPVVALRQMAQDRLKAFGTSGRAVLVIKDALLVRGRDEVVGRMAVELDVYTSDDKRAGFATAEVLQRRSGEMGDLQGTLYDLTKAMMDRMNVELEFQVRRSLRDWLLPDVPADKVSVQQQDLAPPKP